MQEAQRFVFSLPFAGLAVLAGTFFPSCDLLRNGPFEVDGWSPGGGIHDPPPFVSVWFSLEPDRSSVERSFSLTEDGKAVSGAFRWDASRMFFIPSAPLEKNRDYLVGLGTDAQDTKGLSLERRFEASFSTRPENIRPVFLESFPPDRGVLAGERETIRLVFSRAMDRSTFSGFSFSPSVSGVWSTEDSGCSAVFSPQENWIAGKNYRLTVDSEIKSEHGLGLGKQTILHFSAGLDTEAPALVSAAVLDREDAVLKYLETDPESGVENSGWERGGGLELVFSEPVDSASVVSALSSAPSLGFTLRSPPGYGERHVLRLASEPAWGSSFTLELGNSVKDGSGNVLAEKYRYSVKADGPYSKPPSLAGIRLPLNPGEADMDPAVYLPGDLFADLPLESSVFPFDTGTDFWIELYFDTAGGPLGSADIDPFSLMEKFGVVVTNNALSFSPREIKLSGFSIPEPVPGWETFSRAEIRGVLKNQPYGGMVTVQTAQGLADSFGNLSGEAFRILLVK
ncbi:MAG: Ig-like domain-containing protein [Treponema sp.]|nr:Ig-like domain-containing protein [Treponema sp.]